jgi:hypothetical protein
MGLIGSYVGVADGNDKPLLFLLRASWGKWNRFRVLGEPIRVVGGIKDNACISILKLALLSSLVFAGAPVLCLTVLVALVGAESGFFVKSC